jgi:hypothetical protein
MTSKRYTMAEAYQVTAQGTQHIEAFLGRKVTTQALRNVEDDPDYRAQDIDLLWTRQQGGAIKTTSIEIKVDRYFNTGNYFFETLSNVAKQTPGCFLYSKADLLFYYFLDQELHILNLPTVRAWFIQHKSSFKSVRTNTPIGDDHYETEGCLVPRQQLQSALAQHVQRYRAELNGRGFVRVR